MMSTHLGEYAKSSTDMPPNIIPGMYGRSIVLVPSVRCLGLLS